MNSYKIIWVDTDYETHREVVKTRKASSACIEVEQRPDCKEVLDCLCLNHHATDQLQGCEAQTLANLESLTEKKLKKPVDFSQ